MNSGTDDDAFRLTAARRLDPICKRFEEAWKAGRRPRIEDFLPTLAEPELSALRRELLRLEFSYRRQAGDHLQAEEYRLRFPEEADWIGRFLHHSPTPTDLAASAGGGETRGDVPPREAGSALDRTQSYPEVYGPPAASVSGASGKEGLPQVPGYEILTELGRGGMGVVYKARQGSLKRLVALKMIRAGAGAGPEELGRFQREAEAVARLQHPNIVQIYEVGEAQGQPFFSLELIEGGSLAERLDGTPWLPPQAAQLVETLARAMHSAHQRGIIHRDLKPANVLLQKGDSTGATGSTGSGSAHHPVDPVNPVQRLFVPKITDFGLAKQLDQEQGQTQSGAIIGTPGYMAPEQALGKSQVRQVGPATDVYALGAILYELLTGRPPFRGADLLETLQQVIDQDPVPPSRLVPHLPRDLGTICLKCLAKEPGRRYSSALALAQDLERFRAGESILARPESRARRLWRTLRRHRVAVLAAVAGLLGLVVLPVVALSWGQARKTADLEYAIDKGLNPERWTPDQLEQVEAKIGELESLAPEHAAEYRQRLRRLFRRDALDLLHRDHLREEDIRRFKTNARALDAREPGAEKELLQKLKERLRAWETLLEVRPPFDRGTGAFVDADFRPGGNALRRTRGRNPLLLLQTEKGSASEIEARFDPSWSAAEAVGVYLNAGRTRPTTVRTLTCDTGFLASAGRDGVRLWSIDSGSRRVLLEHPEAASCVTLSGLRLLAGVGRQVVVWSLQAEPPKIAERVDPHQGDVLGIAASRDGRWLATGGADGTVKVWTLPPSPTLRQTLKGPKGAVNQVAFTFDGKTLAAASEDGTVHCWEVDSWTPKSFIDTHQGPVWALALHLDGRTLATACKGWVTLWSLGEGKELLRVPARTAPVHCLAFANTWEQRLAVGNALLLPSQRKPGPAVCQENALVSPVAFTPRSNALAVVDEADRTVWLCDPHTGRPQSPADAGRGYAFLLSGRSRVRSSAPAEAGRLPRAGPGGTRRYLQILRDGACLRERAVAVPNGPLILRATREGSDLRVQVNRLEPLALQDAFPLAQARGDFGLHWPPEVGLTYLHLARQAQAIAPSPLETADEHFTAGRYEAALSLYRRQLVRGREGAGEARYKAALCLEKMNRGEEALREYEKVSQAGERWAVLAGCHLWMLLRKRKDFERAEAALAGSVLRSKPEEALLVLPEEMRKEIFREYFLSLVGVHYFLPPPDLVERLEQQLRVVEMLPELPVSREESLRALILAYQIQGKPDQALTRAESYLHDSSRLPSWDRLRVASVLAEYTWLLQGQGKPDQARRELDRWLFDTGRDIPSDHFLMPVHLAFLLMERARLDVALKDWEAVEADVALCLKICRDRDFWSAEILTQARLILGFAREMRGDERGARQAWQEAALRRAVGKDPGAIDRFWNGAHLREMLPQLIQAGLTNDLSDREARAIMLKTAQSFLTDPTVGRAVQLLPFEPSTYQSYRTMWQTERGQALARRLILHQLPLPDAIRHSIFLPAYEIVRQQAFGGSFTKEQDELVWELLQEGYALFREEMRGGKMGLEIRALKDQVLPLGLAWRFGMAPSGLTSALGRLPARLRGRAAYVFGHRLLSKGKTEAARPFFAMALKDADSDPRLKLLARKAMEPLPAKK
jgi:serine/threonine protein kinase/tetratricopeptide (TPR) repeat protein